MAPSRLVVGALVALGALACAGPARAQAVSAFDPAALQRDVAYDLGDLRGVPNALFDSTRGFPNGAAYAIRGGASQGYETSFDPAIGVFQDGIYLGRTAVPILELYDLESVDVRRGPQGVLSGRASPSGAIELRSRRPSGKLGTRGQVSFGDRGLRDYRLALDVPLVPERVAGTVAVFEREASGHFPNAAPPGAGGRLGDVNRWGMRGALDFTPSDGFELLLIADMLHDRSGGPPLRLAQEGGRSFHVAQEMHERNHTDLSGLVADARWEIGRVTLRSLSGWRSARQNVWVDLDAQPVTFWESRRPQSSGLLDEQLSVSTRLFDDALELTLGWAYWQAHASLAQTNAFDTCALFGGCPPGSAPAEAFARSRQTLTSNGFFSGLVWSVSDSLRLHAGARWSVDAQKLGVSFPPVSPLGQVDDSARFRKLAPSVRMDFAPLENVAVWVSYGTGYRPGGFDPLPSPAEASRLQRYDSEVRHSTQAGVRGAWLENRVGLGVSGFYDRVHDLQVARLTTSSLFVPGGVDTRNATSARLAGFDLEAWGRPLESLALRGSFGLLAARYLDLGDALEAELGDPDLVRAPRYTGNAGASWTIALEGAGRVVVDADWTYVSHYATDAANLEFANVPATSLYDGSITWRPERSAWRFTVYGKNLFDRRVPGGGFAVGEELALNGPIAPRTYGVQVGWEYDDLGDLVQ